MRIVLRSAFVGLVVMLLLAACQPGTAPEVSSTPLEGLPVKVTVSQAGMYQINSQTISLPEGVRLFHQGQEVPLFANGDGVRFYAPGGRSRYADQDTYWFAERVPPEAAAPALTPLPPLQGAQDMGLQQSRLEENLLYWPMADQPDPWFWKVSAAANSEEFPLVVLYQPLGSASLRVTLAGKTSAPATPDHRARLYLNGQMVLDESWEGAGAHLLRADLPEGLLRQGENVIRLELPGLADVPAEVVYLDYLVVDYGTALVAQEDRLEWIASGGAAQLSGFSGAVDVYDISDPFVPTQAFSSASGSFAFSGQAGKRYLAIGPRGALAPLALSAPELKPDLRDPALAADLLMVGPPDLLEAAQPLLDWRAQHDVRVLAVPLQAIYDQFGGGVASPEAIRELLRASRSWNTAPRSLLLVGDASFDPLGYTSPPEANRLPVFYVFTEFGGETGSDLPFVDLDGDNLPDLAVGRLPARTPEQISAYAQKVITYEQTPATEVRLVVSVADGQEFSFALDAQAFMQQLPQEFARLEIAPPAGSSDAAQQIIQAFGQSPWLVAYFGHGSIQMWGKDRLFSVEDVASLPQIQQAPIVINMTCLSGLFIHPTQESLSEALLWLPGGGSVGVLAPTSLTLAADQSLLSQPLALALSDGQSATLGDATLRAWRQMPVDSLRGRDVLLTFLLLGDPELRLGGEE